MTEPHVLWEDLPIKYGEEHPNYGRLCYRYAHIGCPGVSYEDNCYLPSECALRGTCRVVYNETPEAKAKRHAYEAQFEDPRDSDFLDCKG